MSRERLTDMRVTAALEEAVAAGEVGVQVAAYLGDELVVDDWVGPVASGSNRLVDGETLFSIFSLTKVLTATALHLQAQRGLLSYDQSVADVWPEYGQAGKSGITIADVMAHRSGAPAIDPDITVDQLRSWSWMTDMLARQEPVAPPNTVNAYSPFAFGWVVGELVRRTDPQHRSFADFARDEVLEPLGMDAFHLGVPSDQLDRVATLTGEEPPVPAEGSLVARSSPAHLPLGPSLFNTEAVRTAVLPSFGGVANARSVAKLLSVYARGALVDGEAFLTPETIERCRRPRPDDVDQTYGVVMPVGLGALWLVAPAISASGPITSGVLSHTAAGGSFAWAEPDTGLAVAICHNRMFFSPRQPMPFAAIGDAVHSVVGLG